MKKPSSDRFHGKFLFSLIGLLFLVFLIVLILLEPMLKNKIVIHNKSSHKITKLTMWFEDEVGTMSNIQDFQTLSASERKKEDSLIKLEDLSGNLFLTIQIGFEDGGETLIQSGQFSHNFEGKISMELSDTKNEELLLKLKAGEGLFNSPNGNGCDVVYYVNPVDGYIE